MRYVRRLIKTINHLITCQVQYGQLKACYKTHTEEDESYCVLQKFYAVEVNGDEVLNEQECPLLLKSKHLISVPTKNVLSPVSIVHECLTCPLQVKRKRRRVEQEEVRIESLILKHDHNNNMFALNVYCMHAQLLPLML